MTPANLRSGSITLAVFAILAFLGNACPSGEAASKKPDGKPKRTQAIVTEADLVKVVARLKRRDTRMQALSELIHFTTDQDFVAGSLPLGEMFTNDPKLDELIKKANEALEKCCDPETVGRALDSPDEAVRWWGLGVFGGEDVQAENPKWLPLLPKLEDHAANEKNSNLRVLAVERLQDYGEAHDFLHKRIQLETSPDVLMRLIREPNRAALHEHFLELFYPLLFHKDEEVRRDALGFLGSNSRRAPMWRFRFDKKVLTRVIELTRSPSAEERSEAAFALTDIRKIDLDRSREAFLHLATDLSDDVRWRVPVGLAGQLDRKDVQPVIAALLKDPSPLVRYTTIQELGPEKFVKELQKLAEGPDKHVAEYAIGTLKQIEERRKSK